MVVAGAASGSVSGGPAGVRRRGRRADRLVLGRHRVTVTEVFWSYWFLAAERQEIFFKRAAGEPGPWALDERFERGERLYSAAYIMPSPGLGRSRKHRNHLALLDGLLSDGTLAKLAAAGSLEELYGGLLQVRSFGPFLAFQYAIDLNYSPHFGFSEMDFVVAGPGALRGIAKCFDDVGGLTPEEVIACMAESAEKFLADQEKPFRDLGGRPLKLIDCQNLFCEVDKYSRVRHPERSNGGPKRIKQRFKPNQRPLHLGYPPKWELEWSAAEPTLAIRI